MLKFDLQKPNDVVAFGRATIDLYANEIGPMEEAKTFLQICGRLSRQHRCRHGPSGSESWLHRQGVR